MPENAVQKRAAADNYLQQAREAMELADRTQSVTLREELLKLAMRWLKLADENKN